MPIKRILVNEFECGHCGHKWINRRYDRNRSIPKNCAGCKRRNWNDPEHETITPSENGLRKQIRRLNKLYLNSEREIGKTVNWEPELPQMFLSIQPRPTVGEMCLVLIYPPLHFTNRGIYSKKIIKPLKEDPLKPGWGIVDTEKLREMKLNEARARMKMMKDIIRSRNSIK